MSANKRHQDKAVLEELYVEQDMSQAEVADELGCTAPTICRWLKKHGIDATDSRGRGDLTKSDTPASYRHVHECGNYYVYWRDSSNNVAFPVHRLLAVAEYGIDEVAGNDVHHKNGIAWDNRPENIEVLTKAQHGMAHP